MGQAPAPQYYDVTIRSIVDFGNETRHFELMFEPGKTIDFTAGQFVAIVYPKDGKTIRRAYSIASPPQKRDGVELVIKLVEQGTVTPWLWTMKQGDKLRVHGPFGKFVLPQPAEFDILFVATGTGIAPFRSMIGHLLPAGFSRKISLLFGSRFEGMIPYHQEFLELAAAHPNFRYVPTISRPGPDWKGETGYVQTKIEKLFADPSNRRVYICGLSEMIQAVQDTCIAHGYSKEQIAYEKYD